MTVRRAKPRASYTPASLFLARTEPSEPLWACLREANAASPSNMGCDNLFWKGLWAPRYNPSESKGKTTNPRQQDLSHALWHQ